MTIKILISDDHKIMRDGLNALIKSQSDMEVVGEAKNGQEALNLTAEKQPDVIIMDVTMPDMNGIEATRQIAGSNKSIKIIGLSMHSDKRFVIEMLKAGASGYILKDCAFDELIDAIHTVIKNKNYLSSELAGTVLDDFIREPQSSNLSARENEILKLIAEGLSTKEIALSIYVSTKTVETHRRNIMKKLDTNSIADLTRIAIRKGLISL